jgi:hypothetical protein
VIKFKESFALLLKMRNLIYTPEVPSRGHRPNSLLEEG